MKKPSLNALKVFEATARHLNMVKSAQELFITHGAVSRQVKLLESQLGVNLFVRRNRAIFLTKAGETLLLACQKAFSEINDAVIDITFGRQNKPLVVSCEPTIAMRWLIARLPNFQEKHPEIVVHLFAAGGAVSFAEKGIDLAIRRNDFDTGCFMEVLAAEAVGPVCVPSMKDSALNKAVRLHANTRLNAWSDWSARTKHDIPDRVDHQYFEHFYLSLQAASAGLGVAIASKFMVEQDLIEGRLVAPYGFIPDGSTYCLLSETDFSEDPRKNIFLDWLRAQFFNQA